MLPSGEHVTRTLSDLLGRPVIAKVMKPLDLNAPRTFLWGVYIDDGSRVRAACGCDLTFAAAAGAAFLMFPPARAQESIKAGKLEDVLQENLAEVLNILAHLFNDAAEDHLRFRNIVIQNGPVPSDVKQVMQARAGSIDFEVSVTGYGNGKLSFMRMPVLAPVAT